MQMVIYTKWLIILNGYLVMCGREGVSQQASLTEKERAVLG